ncbi:MAG: Beta-agarase [Paenibacillaceae bacterium]|jgi:hypothetical protein|nr:Beta-agarase [Paenibacillaceae bacterium]
MEYKLDLDDFTPLHCTLEKSAEGNSMIINAEKTGGAIVLNGPSGRLGGVDWSSDKYIVLDATNLEGWNLGVEFRFWKDSNLTAEADMNIFFGLIPGVKTRLCLPLQALDSQQMFLPRTPGKLKSVVFGNRVETAEVSRFAVGPMKCFDKQRLEISNLHITDKEPDYPLPAKKMVDELGQLTIRDWPGKTGDVEELKQYLTDEADKDVTAAFPENWSRYGGWKEKRFDATGYFRTQHDGTRWWLVDPEGYAFISTGIDSVNPGEAGRIQDIEAFYEKFPDKDGEFSDAWRLGERFDDQAYYNFAVANLIRAFGRNWWEPWARLTKRRLMEWGVNTIANWSSLEFIRYAKMSYVWPLVGFPQTEKKIFRDFPDVFSEEYQREAEKFAQQLKEFAGDSYLIGYFLRNEPTWAFVEDLNIAEELLAYPEDLASKDELIQFISNRYEGSIEKLNAAWNTGFIFFEQLKEPIKKASRLSEAAAQDLEDFSEIMIRNYVRIPSEAVKRVDPYHLNLGMRYGEICQAKQVSGCEYFDVFSFNCYKMDPAKEIEKIGKMTNLPVMIGEYHFGALDRGLMSTGLRGVSSQAERGKAYQFYLENGAAEKYFTGAHYFIYNDQAVLGRFDGESNQIGCVDVCNRPYKEFIEYMTKTNRTLYQVADGKVEKCKTPAEEMERVCF